MIRKNIGCSFKPKRILCFLLAITVFASFSACTKAGDTNPQDNAPKQTDMMTENASYPETDTPSQAPNILVAYFSETGTTEGIAERISAGIGGVLYAITPSQPYNSADLSYNNDDCRANKEQNGPDARPVINGKIENIDEYDVLFLGYPIW